METNSPQYVYLSSSDSSDYFDGNTTSEFTNVLPRSLRFPLGEKWRVAVHSVHCSNDVVSNVEVDYIKVRTDIIQPTVASENVLCVFPKKPFNVDEGRALSFEPYNKEFFPLSNEFIDRITIRLSNSKSSVPLKFTFGQPSLVVLEFKMFPRKTNEFIVRVDSSLDVEGSASDFRAELPGSITRDPTKKWSVALNSILYEGAFQQALPRGAFAGYEHHLLDVLYDTRFTTTYGGRETRSAGVIDNELSRSRGRRVENEDEAMDSDTGGAGSSGASNPSAGDGGSDGAGATAGVSDVLDGASESVTIDTNAVPKNIQAVPAVPSPPLNTPVEEDVDTNEISKSILMEMLEDAMHQKRVKKMLPTLEFESNLDLFTQFRAMLISIVDEPTRDGTPPAQIFLGVRINAQTNLITFRTKYKTILKITYTLAVMLGMKKDPDENGMVSIVSGPDEDISFDEPINYNAWVPHFIMVYANCIEYTPIGSVTVPVLRVIPIGLPSENSAKKEEPFQFYEPRTLEPHRVMYSQLTNLEFKLRTIDGRPVQFKNKKHKVILSLKFIQETA